MTARRIALMVDSACDLPSDFFLHDNVFLIPTAINIGGEVFLDIRDPTVTEVFFKDKIKNSVHGTTEPYSAAKIQEMVVENMCLDYDYVVCQTIAQKRSKFHANASDAANKMAADTSGKRRANNIKGPFAFRVFDTGTLFTGQGVIAYETLKMINAGMDSNSIKDNIEVMSRLTHAYLLPDDLSHLMRRRDHNDRTTSWMTKTLAGLLDLRPLLSAFRNDTQKVATVRGFDEGLRRSFAYLERRIKAGLLYPTIALSYGGLLNKVPQMPGYAAFKKTADEHGVEVLLASMSVTVGMNVGPGGLTFGFISEEHKLDW